MADKWRTTITEANAVLMKYGVEPFEPQTEILVRKWTGISRVSIDTLVATLKATTTVTDPMADNRTYTGNWTVKSIDSEPDDSGNLVGSFSIIQVLNKWRTTLEESQALLVKYGVDPYEPQTTVLIRKWTGIDRTVADTLIVAAAETIDVNDPQADGQTYEGGWTVQSIEQDQDGGSNTSGSVTIIQTLNKWRTTLTEAQSLFVKYSVNPSEVSEESLVRQWTGIDRDYLASLISTLRSTTTVTDPKADGQTYSGTWTVGSVEPMIDKGGNTAGSATIVQILKKNVYSDASPANLTIVRSRAYPLEQNENAWMYYERYKSEVTKRWHNIKAANIEAEYDKIRMIYDSGGGNYTLSHSNLYKIFFMSGDGGNILTPTGGFAVHAEGNTYWEPTIVGSVGAYLVWTASEISNPVIRECWYEQNTDGTYNLFRTLETTSSTAIKRTRALQYAGMTLVSGEPVLAATTITISGFNKLTEVVYKDARFRIGSDIYRVTANTTAVAGVATNIPITPAITQASDDACGENVNQTQVFFEAL